MDMLCDPDYINQKILAYIRQQEKLMADTKRTYTYAASYEDFVKMINLSDSLDELKQMRCARLHFVLFAGVGGDVGVCVDGVCWRC